MMMTGDLSVKGLINSDQRRFFSSRLGNTYGNHMTLNNRFEEFGMFDISVDSTFQQTLQVFRYFLFFSYLSPFCTSSSYLSGMKEELMSGCLFLPRPCSPYNSFMPSLPLYLLRSFPYSFMALFSAPPSFRHLPISFILLFVIFLIGYQPGFHCPFILL